MGRCSAELQFGGYDPAPEGATSSGYRWFTMTARMLADGAPWYGLDEGAMRVVELHEARAHEHPGRRVADLGDAILLHDPGDPEPFLNRLSGLRLPDDPSAFDQRLGDLIRLFGTIGRRPHLWLGAGFNTPADLPSRLRRAGFREVGATFLMVLHGGPRAGDAAPTSGTAQVERVQRHSGFERRRLLEQAADVLIEAFDATAADRRVLGRELDPDDRSDLCVLLLDGVAVAAGRRYTADGLTYLSSIGTRSGWSGRGYGSTVTRALVADARGESDGLIHLAVDASNARARSVYERIGFVVVGDRATAHVLQ